MLTFRREKLNEQLREELSKLLHMQFEEVGVFKEIKLNPDWNMYENADRFGKLFIFTARASAELVGYSVFFVSGHPHSKDSVQAVQDVIYLKPNYRGTNGGLIQFAEAELKAHGVDVIYISVKKAHNFGDLLEKLGFELVDLIYGKKLAHVQHDLA